MKIRTIITQDGEVDDQNSLRHFLFYTNEVDLQGIVLTSSRFHWIGKKGAKPIEGKDYATKGGSFEEPFRWTGIQWMYDELDDYEKDYPNLCVHSKDYPTPDYLRSITKVGNIGHISEMEEVTEGSELIKERILDDDERTLYIQVWGGTNTIARALKSVQEEYENSPQWKELHEKITKKVVLIACGEQDTTYRDYIAEVWPGIQFVPALQMHSYAYFWYLMPECESKDTLKAEFMKNEILNGKSQLANGYCTWLDGTYYEGEAEKSQFGSQPNIENEWFGARMMGITNITKYDFLSEGDSPTFFCLFDWGLRTLEDFSYGGFSGRYHSITTQTNSKGETLNMWETDMDMFTDYSGETKLRDSMWPYVCDIQRDFASRVDWASQNDYMNAEHKPTLTVEEGLDFECEANEELVIHVKASTTDRTHATVTYRVYEDASSACAKDVKIVVDENQTTIQIPETAKSGDTIHVIVKAQGDGHFKLVRYQQMIIKIK